MSRPRRLRGAELLDPELGRLEPFDAGAVELLAAPEERDRVVDCDIAPLEAGTISSSSFCSSSKARFVHGRTSSTRAPSAPAASSISSRSPAETDAASRTASPPARTIAYPRARVASGESALAGPRWSRPHGGAREAGAEPPAGALPAREPVAVVREVVRDGRRRWRQVSRAARSSRSIRDDERTRGGRRRRARVGREVAEGRVLLVPDRGDHGHRARRDRADDRLRAERKQIFEAPAAARETTIDLRMRRERVQAGDDGLGRAPTLDSRLADDRLRRGKRAADRREEGRRGRPRPRR